MIPYHIKAERIQMRQCNKCLLTKEDGDFYPSIPNQCKSCRAEYERTYRRLNADRLNQRDRDRWKNDPERRKQTALRTEKARKKYPDRHNARMKVKRAIKSGRMTRPETCSVCLQGDVRIEGHHEDYSKPLDVIWMCRRCHLTADGRSIF